MTTSRSTRFGRFTTALAIALIVLTAASMRESQAQIHQSMKIKLNVSASVSVAGMGTEVQRTLAEETPNLSEMFPWRLSSSNSIISRSGFTISAYQNITVLISFTTPGQVDRKSNDTPAMQIVCGYLNDGTTNFKRATITDESPVQFLLRNSSQLLRSKEGNNPLFEAYVFFLVSQRKDVAGNGSQIPVSSVTVELL